MIDPEDPKLMSAHDTAMDAVALWARTNNGYSSMKEKVQKYFSMHDQMVGATTNDEKITMRKSLNKWLAFELCFPMFRLNDYTVRIAVNELDRIAEDLPLKQNRGRHI